MALISASWEAHPSALADHVGTTLSVDVNADSKLAINCRRSLRGVSVAGVAASVRFSYAFVMLLAAVAVIGDTADLTLRGLCLLRGTFEMAWIQALLRALDALGLFDQAPACLEELLIRVQSKLRELAVPLPEQQLTGADYNQDFTWVPGHFGPAANQPW